jgi:hypothetical protein
MKQIGCSPPLPHPIRRVKFIPIEDARLLELVSLFGETDWISHCPYLTDGQTHGIVVNDLRSSTSHWEAPRPLLE